MQNLRSIGMGCVAQKIQGQTICPDCIALSDGSEEFSNNVAFFLNLRPMG